MDLSSKARVVRAHEESFDEQQAFAASPVAHVLAEGDVVLAANAAARVLLAVSEPEGRSLSALLAELPTPPRLIAAPGQDAPRRLLALLPGRDAEAVDDALDALVGAAFLERLLERLASETGAFMGFVGEFAGSAEIPVVDTLAVVIDGAPAPAFRYALAHSPCSAVSRGDLCIHAEHVAERFPDDAALAARGAEGYAGMPIVDVSGRVLGILVLLFREPITDTSALRRRLLACAPRAAAEVERTGFERRVEQSDLRYRKLVEDSDDGLIVFQGRVPVYVNPAAARILGFPSTKAMLDDVDDVVDLVSDEDRDFVARQVDARISGIRVNNVFELGARHRDGQVVPVQVTASELDWEGARSVQVLFVDLSARKNRDERVRQAERLASLGKLTGGIAHDFNNLLAVILGNLELVAQEVEGSAEKAVYKARIAAQRGAELTERLLTFARRQALRPQAVATTRLLEETRGLLAPVLGEDIELVIGTDCEALVQVDPSQLQSALINLAVNARDALEGGGRVVIGARLVDAVAMRERFPEADDQAFAAHVCIEVSDTGPGMPPEVRTQAFEPFFTTKGAHKGTGLGLSMVHGFVKQSRGQIELDSAPGEGTRIRLFLPCAEAAMPVRVAPAAATDVPENGPVGARRRALVIEDEESVREVAVAMLEGLGFEVEEAGNGPDARAVLARERFDLLLSDVVLPAGQRGPDIAADALGRDPDMAVLFMSGYAETSDFQRFRLEHDFRLVRKPFRFDQLRSEIEDVLQARRAS